VQGEIEGDDVRLCRENAKIIVMLGCAGRMQKELCSVVQQGEGFFKRNI